MSTFSHPPSNGDEAEQHPAELDSVIRFIATRMGAEASMLAVRDGTPGEPRVYASWGPPLGPEVLHGVAGDGSIGHALARNEPLARRLTAAEGQNGGPRIAEAVIAPVESPSGVRGALCAGYARALEGRTEAVLTELRAYAAVLGLWLDDSEALVRLLRAAHEDALTGCVTYPGLAHRLDNEVRRSERTGQPLSCLFIAVDDYGAFNAQNGHVNGERVLVEIAHTLRERLRDTDTVARFGGDQFVVLLPDTSCGAASRVSKALQAAVRISTADLLGGPATVSIGVGELHAGMTSAELVDVADHSLRILKT
ncbi:MAG: GGDEF domain-containing protein [Vicinamibacteria bacterium]|jgi:diguanylate cyclase (GGDEF)-like protein